MDFGFFEGDLEVGKWHFANFEGEVEGLKDFGGDLERGIKF